MREELTSVLGVARLGQRREADQIGEENGDAPALGGGRWRSRWRCLVRDRPAALAAELDAGCVRCSAGGTQDRELRSALAAELAAGLVLGTASRANHPA